ncbi:MAG TPA: ATP-dependent DNA helicase [Candidatus Cybelea sp.]|nr:ATP-dependent DNA helicase [Candidatus Cybelea sp.]
MALVLELDPPSLVVGLKDAAWRAVEGGVRRVGHGEAIRLLRSAPPLLCHLPAVVRRLRCERFPAFDLLELYAFVRPASFCLPTPTGVAQALGLLPAGGGHMLELERQAELLRDCARALLNELSALDRQRWRVRGIAEAMAKNGWIWGDAVLAALPRFEGRAVPGVAVWEDLPEWTETAPQPQADSIPVGAVETRERLHRLLGSDSEDRPSQADYASALVPAFSPRENQGEPHLVLAEAGTGVGKTLGYIAPAGLWAEKNKGPVWISTFTRHLQHQIDAELDRLYANPVLKAEKVVIRKGRENYLCLLNLAEMAGELGQRPQDAVAFGLMARWAMATRDGDMAGGDLPGWLPDLLGSARTLGLADRRGECVYSACPHYGRCFIERSVRRARKAEIVIANHALVMIQAALGPDEQTLPTRYVFDEGHHLFAAVDSAFAAHLSGQEAGDLRRWLIGSEGGRRSRARGLRRRLEDLVLDDARAMDALEAIMQAARALPGDGWHQRVADGLPGNPSEAFLAAVRHQVLARAPEDRAGYSLECVTQPADPRVLEAADALDRALKNLQVPMRALALLLSQRLDKDADVLDPQTRLRIEAMTRGIARRAELEITAWRDMLTALHGATPPDFVDWFALERIDGRETDVGLYRHWLDPMRPFAEVVAKPAHGIVVTSATLTDGSGTAEAWDGAEARTGARHLPKPAFRVRVPSPFDYAAQTRVMIVTDLARDDMDQIAAAYRALFLAAKGGALGLFTAIARLRAVHRRIAPALEAAGIDLLAQHVDAINTATLIDIFRGEEDACLLGTDAVRDGVDVPGRALRLMVFDRVPWPRPDILHKARKEHFGGTEYEDQLTRLKLKQAFGRLIRRADDRGVFVLLDKAMPSRLLTAFPEGVEVQRIGLKQAIETTAAFLSNSA